MFKWKDEFSVNVASIDEQHKRLFEIGSELDDLMALNDEYDHYDEIIDILNKLKDYTIYHFDYEEELFEKYDYEESVSHHFEHHFFIKRLEKLCKKDIDSQQQEAIHEIYTFILDWISEHILKSDMKYKDFLISKGVN